jgi:hypothetical protein
MLLHLVHKNISSGHPAGTQNPLKYLTFLYRHLDLCYLHGVVVVRGIQKVCDFQSVTTK